MLKEAADKLLGGNGRESGPICGRVLVGECDQAIIEREDAAIAGGDAKDVRSEVFEGGLARAYRLRVNDPIFAPDLLIKEMEEIALFEQVPELGAEEDRERLDVNEEILPGLEPPAIGGESASGGDVVNVRMIVSRRQNGVGPEKNCADFFLRRSFQQGLHKPPVLWKVLSRIFAPQLLHSLVIQKCNLTIVFTWPRRAKRGNPSPPWRGTSAGATSYAAHHQRRDM